jgi:hypothetical protein
MGHEIQAVQMNPTGTLDLDEAFQGAIRSGTRGWRMLELELDDLAVGWVDADEEK